MKRIRDEIVHYLLFRLFNSSQLGGRVSSCKILNIQKLLIREEKRKEGKEEGVKVLRYLKGKFLFFTFITREHSIDLSANL